MPPNSDWQSPTPDHTPEHRSGDDTGPPPQPAKPCDDGLTPEAVADSSPFEHGPETRQLVLVKDGQRYVFRYAAGEENVVLERLIELVRDDSSDLDWFDAAVLSHQMGQRMSRKLETLLKG